MNERIQELIKEATISRVITGPEVFTNPPIYFDKEKFAELLIRDTVKQCAEFAEYQLQIGGTNADKIKQYFGVK